jgi:hypothetical protein
MHLDGRFRFVLNGRVFAEAKNTVLDAAVRALWSTMFASASQSASWYIGLIGGTWSGIAWTDTLASHPGWNESAVCGGRKLWTPAAPSARQITGQSTVQFVFSGSDAIRGAFLCNAAAGTSGLLWSAGGFSALNVLSGDFLTVGYTLSA